MLEIAAVSYAAPVAVPMLQAAAAPVMAVAAPILAAGAPVAAASAAPFILTGAMAAGAAYGIHKMVCWFRDPEPDREVDNDVRERNENAIGDFTRHREIERVFEVRSERSRPWSETGKDTVECVEKLWEASQMIGTKNPVGVALGAERLSEASGPATRVAEDLIKDVEHVAKESVNYFIDSRVHAIENGTAQYLDMGG